MLGCQDFCGYYDWTFSYLEQRFGREALRDYWAAAIGGDSQGHYLRAGREDGLRGLLRAWVRTGQDEHCDWTFTLDEARNTLRWDMRRCPSKGFLLQNDLNASEDYCDHCMGWIIPLLDAMGAGIAAHEHNHCGQCWAEISLKGRPREPLQAPADIRDDPNWKRGYLDRWRDGVKLPLLERPGASADPSELIERWFARADPPAAHGAGRSAGVLCADEHYAAGCALGGPAAGVLLGHPPAMLEAVAERFLGSPPESRPLLMHLYLPACEPVAFAAYGLPRPVPVLPLLIRHGRYVHRPGAPPPTTTGFLSMLADVLKADVVRGPGGPGGDHGA